MGVNCCVPGCNSVNNKHKTLKFHKFPKDKKLSKCWEIAIKTGKSIGKYSSVCSKHFKEDDYTITSMGQWKILHKTAVPTLHLPMRKFDQAPSKCSIRRKEKYAARANEITGNLNKISVSTSSENCIEIKAATGEIQGSPYECVGNEIAIVAEENGGCEEHYRTAQTSSTQTILTCTRFQLISCSFLNEKQLHHFTGFTKNQFKVLFDLTVFQARTNSALNTEDELLLCLMMYRQKLYYSSLQYFFSVSRQIVYKIFFYWTVVIYKLLKSIDFLSCNHKKFQAKYDLIIDCTEIAIEKSSNPVIQQATYSEYKSTNTFKGLVGVSEEGAVIFVSDLWGGSVSDRQLLQESCLLDVLKEGMFVLADRGFDVSDLFENKGIHLNIPPFKRGQPQLSEVDVARTRAIANRRIVVENVIGLVKKNSILTHRMPQHLWHMSNEIFYNCFMLTNFKNRIIFESPEKIIEIDGKQ